MEHGRGVHAVTALPIGCERLAIARGGLRVVGFEACEVTEVDQVRRGGLGTVSAPVRGQRRLEGAARCRQVAQCLSDEAQVVLIGRQAAGVPRVLADL